MPLEEIAILLVPPVTVDQLKLDYAVQLEMGPAKANLEVTSGLLASARKGNTTAQIYWTKSRMGWTERGPGEKEKVPPSENTPAEGPMPTAEMLGAIPLESYRKK